MKEIIVVNGVRYDAETGQAIEREMVKNTAVNSNKIHSNIMRSQTLNRKFVSRPANQTQAQNLSDFKHRHDIIEIQKKSLIRTEKSGREFSKDKIISTQSSAKRVILPISQSSSSDLKKKQIDEKIESVKTHPAEFYANNEFRKKNQPQIRMTTKEIKDEAIYNALNKARVQDMAVRKKKRGVVKDFWREHKFFANFLTGAAVFSVGVGYLTYLNLPDISTKIASVQSGVTASLPHYSPSGYKLDGLANFDGNTVNVAYKNGENSYKIKQSQISWDSLALLENYVSPKWNADYVTYLEKGITIYKNPNNQAVWVNDGKMYTLEGNKQLSDEDIRKIATSF